MENVREMFLYHGKNHNRKADVHIPNNKKNFFYSFNASLFLRSAFVLCTVQQQHILILFHCFDFLKTENHIVLFFPHFIVNIFHF